MRNFYLTLEELQAAAELYGTRFPLLAAETLEYAEEACRNRFKVPFTMVADRFVDMGDPVDWLHNPTADLEFTWELNRHWYMKKLGIAYLLTGDERYVRTFMRHIRSWRKQNPVPAGLSYEVATYFQQPGPWRLLEVGLRVQSWIWAAKLMEGCEAMTQDFRDELRQGLSEHAAYLTRYWGSTEINHATMHMQGLFMIGTFCHEHPDAPSWRQIAMERLELCILHQFGNDGIQKELTTHYHNGSISMLGTPFLLAQRTGYPVSEWYAEKLGKMGDFTEALIRPDLASTAAGDSDWIGYAAEELGFLGVLLEEERFIRMGRCGEELLWLIGADKFTELEQKFAHSAPGTESKAFPETGYYVMKNERNYLFFDAASMGGAHGHADVLAFEWMWKQCLWFVDPGRYTYEEGYWRHYFKSTRAHNTVTVDGEDQTPYLATQQWGSPAAEPMLHRWAETEHYHLIDASHNGYERLAAPVRHRRWLLLGKRSDVLIVVDWLEGEGEHRIEQRFQLHPEARLHIGDDANSAEITDTLSKARLQIGWTAAAAGGSQGAGFAACAEEGWISKCYGSKTSSTVLSFNGTMKRDLAIAAVFIPAAEGEEERAVKLQACQVDQAGKEVTVHLLNGSESIVIRLGEETVAWQNGVLQSEC